MRLRAILFVLAGLAAFAAGARRLGEETAAYVERETAARATQGLAAAGEGWAEIETDGLIVTLTGAAPDEARRLRAAELLRQIVDPRRVRDLTVTRAAEGLPPPPFALELLRNEAEVSLIGLVPEDEGRRPIAASLARARLDGAVIDMLEPVGRPSPDGWAPALDFGLDAVRRLSQAKVSVTPGAVKVVALAASQAERDAMEAELRANLPDDVTLEIEISAPRPVIAPFTVDFTLAEGRGRLSACAAETAQDAARIAAAAGAPAKDCMLGLGAPSPDWAAAAVEGLAAVRRLGGGTFSLTDLDATLTAPAETDRVRLEAEGATLSAALPSDFALTVAAPETTPADVAPEETATPRFAAELGPDGDLRLTGRVQDATSREAIGGFAAALFGHDRVVNATSIEPGLPDGWPGRVLAGIETLALLKEGALEVTPAGVSVSGWASEPDGAARAEALLAAKEVGAAALAVRFDAAAAAAEAAMLAPPPDVAALCMERIAAAQSDEGVNFEPGSAEIEEASAGVVAALAAAMAECPALEIEVAGHTDGQGGAEANQRLSEKRAAAVTDALEATGLARRLRLVARGYGAARPLAENDTEAGRARNRRIEFALLRDLRPGPASGGDGTAAPSAAPVADAAPPAPDGAPR